MKYYGVDRGNPITDENYSLLSKHNVNTMVVWADISSGKAVWQNIINLSSKYDYNVVILPYDWVNYKTNWPPRCGWDIPYVKSNPSDYIYKVKPMLSYLFNPSNWPNEKMNVIGIFNAHEPFWSCIMTIDEMAAIKDQLKTYIKRNSNADIQVWNYVDNIAENSSNGLTGRNIARIMDVAVTWQHCFGGAEGTCEQAKQKILADRAAINNAGLDGKVDLVYLIQTFAYGSGYRMPTASELNDWSCAFLGTNALDGFLFYSWGACWYDSDLWCPANTHPHQDLWPSMNAVYDRCVVKH